MKLWVGRFLGAYLRPGKQVQAQVADGISDATTLAMAMLFGVVNLLATLPSLFNQAALRNQPIEGLLGAQMLSSLILMPLVLFGVAAIVHILCKLLRGKASFTAARRGLVWSALVATPFVLLNGWIGGALPQTARFWLLGLTAIVFIWQWSVAINELEFSE